MKNLYLLFATLLLSLLAATVHAQQPPNIILIFTDDQGYGDVGCYGAKGFKTPNIDQMAKEGSRFTSFYTGCSVCSGSRAALLTGRHYKRVGIPAVMFPGNRNGMDPREVTLAEMLRMAGYRTGIIGKWHLGHLPRFLPTKQGFDSFYGIPYSNDMTIDPMNAKFASDVVFRLGFTEEKALQEKPIRNEVPLMRGDEIIEYPTDQSTLTKRYTQEAIRFIETNKSDPFFLYLPHTMPHVPLFASKEFKGRTKTLFGDVMEEMDWSVGEILKSVKANGLDEKTLVIFTTDNGAHQGSSGPLRAKKASMYEGGFRVPFIARWPGKIPAGAECDEVAATIDMLPTFAKIAGGKVPMDRVIDGKDISELLFAKPGAKSPHEFYFLAHNNGAVRSGQWKFYPWPEGQGKKKADPPPKDQPRVQLDNLSKDLGEKTNVAAMHPDVVSRLAAAYQEHLVDIKKNKLPPEKKE
jgi:arylsulfatase A